MRSSLELPPGTAPERPPTATGGQRRQGMPRRDFFEDVVDAARAALPDALAGFRHRAGASLLKLYYDNERVHFEVWPNAHLRLTEIGLHFEDGPVSTAAYLTYFDRLIVELKHELGPSVELERWTTSWGHLYELAPLTTLNARLAAETGRRLARFIEVLQPLVAAAGVPPERAAQPAMERGPWRHWRRGSR